MRTRGTSAIKGICSLNTRPGPITESGAHLKLHQLAAEKENLLKKLEWMQAQKDQTEKRLTEIARAMHALEKTIRERTRTEEAANANAAPHSTFITY